MRRDCLLSLSRLRRFQVDEAKRELARTVSVAMQAMGEAEQAEAKIVSERVSATEDPSQAPAFASWVPHGRAQADLRAQAALDAQAASDAERERLAQARAAERVVDELAAAREAEAQLEALRKIQAVADEIAADRLRRKRESNGFSEDQAMLEPGEPPDSVVVVDRSLEWSDVASG